MSKLYHIKESIKKTLKKIPLFYSLGHKIMLNKEEEKKEKLRESFKKYGVQGIKDAQKLMETSGWEFFFSCGTLLGIIRENGVIEHDVDLDLAIMENENFSWEKLDELMSTINFTPFRSFYLKDEVVEKTYIRDGLQIDIYVEEIIDENYMEAPFFYRRNHINYVDRMEHSVAFMRDKRTKNILRKKIFDFYVNIPENYEDILYGNYGENWRIPIKNNEIWTAPNLIFDENIKGYKVMH